VSDSLSAIDKWAEDVDLDVSALFQAERERLLGLLVGLTADDWQRPTPCPGWTVLDLANHLLGDDLGWLARNRDGYLRQHHQGPPSRLERSSPTRNSGR
jgi:uncharacterized protein (TIGR03083 family)